MRSVDRTMSLRGLGAKGGLTRQLTGHSPQRFLERTLTFGMPFARAVGSALLARLNEVPEVESVERLLSVHRHRLSAWGRSVSALRPISESSRRRRTALALHQLRSGASLFFEHVEHDVPQVRRLLYRLEAELGLCRDSVTCQAFASRRNSGVRMHFDSDSAFNIQLRGEKTWWLARNAHSSAPLRGWSVSDSPTPGDPLLAPYSRYPFPQALPARSRTLHVGPGQVVFIPVGTWHETRCHSDSFSLILAVRSPRVGEAILSTLDQTLRGTLAWRQAVWGLGVGGEGARRSRRALVEARRALRRKLLTLTAPAVEHALARRHTRFFFCAGASRGALRRMALATAKSDRGKEPDEGLMQELLAWIERNADGFDVEEPASALGLDALGVHHVLDELVDAGVLTEA